jgi:dihydrofolate reductase
MRKVSVFNMVSIDGYIADSNGDISWAHQQDPEWKEFAETNASGGGVLLFGRITYDLMCSHWPTPMAAKNDPVVAAGMNKAVKLVVSRTLDKPTWNNTTVIKDDLPTAIHSLKQQPGSDVVILGSGSIVAQLTQAGLIDSYQIMVIPMVLGSGKSMFTGVTDRRRMKLTNTRAFRNGSVLLSYEQA